MLKSVNPATGRIVETYETHSEKGVEKIINATDKSWHQWRMTSFAQRGALMQNISTVLKSRKEEIARLMAYEMGKVLKEGIAEIEKCAWVCEYYGQNAESFLENEFIEIGRASCRERV